MKKSSVHKKNKKVEKIKNNKIIIGLGILLLVVLVGIIYYFNRYWFENFY